MTYSESGRIAQLEAQVTQLLSLLDTAGAAIADKILSQHRLADEMFAGLSGGVPGPESDRIESRRRGVRWGIQMAQAIARDWNWREVSQ